MEETNTNESLVTVSASGSDVPARVSSATRLAANAPGTYTCPSCGGIPTSGGGASAIPTYIYAIGRIEARFPRASVEKELAQVTARTETDGLTDRQVLQRVLSQRKNRYL